MLHYQQGQKRRTNYDDLIVNEGYKYTVLIHVKIVNVKRRFNINYGWNNNNCRSIINDSDDDISI